MEEKKKSNFKWWYIPVGIIVLGMIGSMLGGEDKGKESNVASDSTNTSSEKLISEKATAWSFQTQTDKMSGKNEYYATISANELLSFEFPYQGGSEAKLQLRKSTNGTDLMLLISKGQFNLGIDGGSAKIRFDEDPAFSVTLTGPSDSSSDVVFLGSVKKCIEKMKKSKKTLIEVEFFNEGTRVIEFQTSGLVWSH